MLVYYGYIEKERLPMKILSFIFDQEVKFGPKVKKEEAVWDVLEIQKQLNVLPAFPNILLHNH